LVLDSDGQLTDSNESGLPATELPRGFSHVPSLTWRNSRKNEK